MTKVEATPQPVIEVEHLSTRFGNAMVHDDVSFTVLRGEVFAVAGASGSGKSVLLRELTMLRRPESGTIRILGTDLTAIEERQSMDLRRRTGVLFQQGALFSALTVAENIAVPLREHTKLSAEFIREIVAIKLGWVKLPADSANKYPSELSGGMVKRAALARALALDPELLFLDEPTAGLDPANAAALDELICQLKSILGLTIVMVTHDIDSLWQVAGRVGVLGGGTVLQIGTMAELSESAHPSIAQYFHGPRGRAAREQAWNRR